MTNGGNDKLTCNYVKKSNVNAFRNKDYPEMCLFSKIFNSTYVCRVEY